MPRIFVPHFLARYKDAASVEDVGSIVQPNLERVHGARPDLILITSLQANRFEELSEMAPTLHFDVDYRDSQARHIDVRGHLMTLGDVFARQALARQKVNELDTRVEEVRRITAGRPDKALVVLHNNGAFNSFGVQSRYGFIFSALGVKPAGECRNRPAWPADFQRIHPAGQPRHHLRRRPHGSDGASAGDGCPKHG